MSSAHEGPADQSEASLRYGLALLAEAREEVARADGKAATLLAATMVVAGVVLAGCLAGDWSPSRLPTLFHFVWWVGLAVACTGSALLLATIYPRVSIQGQETDGLFYFMDAAKQPSSQDVRRAIEQFGIDPIARVSHQLWRISRVAQRKYRLVRWASWLIPIGATTMIVAGVLPSLANC